MSRSKETYNKKEVRNKKEKKRKEKEKKRIARKENEKNSMDDMIAYVDENGMITSTPPDPGKRKEVKLEDIQIGVPSRDPDEEEDLLRKGVITFFDQSKGFGFIRDMENGAKVFVHINYLLEPVKEDNVVTFEVEKGPKGLTARQVKLYKPEPKKD